jgi:multicomponent Na+:H+ antiporter subunit B
MEAFILLALLSFLVLTAIAITRLTDLFAVVMLSGIYSLISALLFVVMDAVDVAFTEASVGAGISTLLMVSSLRLAGRYERPSRHNPILGFFVVLVAGSLLIYATLDMPSFGSINAPIHQYVAPHYIDDSMKEIGLPNIVTSVLASYRGYDTMGEVAVIFTAGIGVLALLSISRRRSVEREKTEHGRMHEQMILRIVSKALIPFILLFALYVQFHGDYGPGGGFQAGVIFAAAIILYAMLFGFPAAERVVNFSLVRLLSAIGVLIYGSVGVVSLISGENFLDYTALAADPVSGQHLGIMLIELGVGITVASVMMIVFFTFNARALQRKEKYL